MITTPTFSSSAYTVDELAPYRGTFDPDDAFYLLRRTRYGVRYEEAQAASKAGLSATLDGLLAPPPDLGEPLNTESEDDPYVPIGKSWAKAPHVDGDNYRDDSIRAYQMLMYLAEDSTIAAKMSLFWKNHFSAVREFDQRAYYNYLATLRRHTIGNFRKLITEVTVEPVMLRFLNGDKSVGYSPNENYARELLELFTLGKGEQGEEGDYGNFTEDDIRAFARALTGWRLRDIHSKVPGVMPGSEFDPKFHDDTDKQLSGYFGNTVIKDAGADEYKIVINTIFKNSRIGDYLCRKLYRYFVYHKITPAIERDIIKPLGAMLRENDFNVKPVLRTLLESEHFFARVNRTGLIKSPLEFQIDTFRCLGHDLPKDNRTLYWFARKIDYSTKRLEQDIGVAPSVAGWKAYYQAPQYNRIWINASTITERAKIVKQATTNGFDSRDYDQQVPDLLAFVGSIPDAEDPNKLVQRISCRLIYEALTPEQLEGLKNVLIPGLPDFEWTAEYGNYLRNPGDKMIARSVRNKVANLVSAIMNSAEFHLY